MDVQRNDAGLTKMNFDPEIVVPPKNKCNGIARKCGGGSKDYVATGEAPVARSKRSGDHRGVFLFEV
jgi:hypothetical protein